MELGSPEETLEKVGGAAVFGEVKKIKVDLNQEGFTGTKETIRYILVDVERSWNIEVNSQVIVATDYTWGHAFKKGQNYVIFVSEVDGELISSPCSQTLEMSNLNQATELFGEGFRPIKEVNVGHKMWFMFEHDVDMFIVLAALVLVIIVVCLVIARKNKANNPRQ